MLTVTPPKFKMQINRLNDLKRLRFRRIMNNVARLGVTLLSEATPVDTGETSKSWSYELASKGDLYTITWKNSVMAGDTPLVILIQYGHGTGTGGYVHRNDFISPALDPVISVLKELIISEVSA